MSARVRVLGCAAPLVAFACNRPDPELARFAQARDAWREGEAATGAAAVDAYTRARALDPDSVALALALAHAQAAVGDLAAADTTLTDTLRAHPDAGEAWYNRAAYRARAGKAADAADDLKHALAAGVRSPLEAAADPDFATVLQAPELAAILPAQPLLLKVDGPAGSVFLGSRFAVDLYVASLPGAEVHVRRDGADPGCARLVRVLEDDRTQPGMDVRKLTLDFEARAVCAGPLGPFTAVAGTATTSAPAWPVQVELPPGANVVAPPPLVTEVPVPGRLAPDGSGYAAVRVGAGVAAIGRADHPVTSSSGPAEVALEWRVDGQTRAVGGWWRSSGPVDLRGEGWRTTVGGTTTAGTGSGD